MSLKQLNVREWINDNPGIMIGLTVFSVFVFLVIVICQLMPTGKTKIEESDKEWFYDLNTSKLFVAKRGRTPPIDSPSGPLPDGRLVGVRAYVFTYTYPPNESDRFIGFLEMPDPNANQAAVDSQPWGQGKLIRRVEDDQWYAADSNEGQMIIKETLRPNEKGQYPNYWPPK